jgi:nucleoside-diphosphate-sugar epimerase
VTRNLGETAIFAHPNALSRSFATVALTGGTGLIGKRLVPALRAAGIHVRLLSRTPRAPQPGITNVVGDLQDPAALRELLRSANAAIHLGGIAHTSLRTEAERNHAREINVRSTIRLFELAKEEGIERVIFASTAHVYAGQRGLQLNEQSPVAGDSFYSGLKLEAETEAQVAVRQGLDVVILRPCIVYGPGVRFNLASLMQAIRRGYYFHAGNVDPVRSFASVDTVAAAIVHLLYAGVSGQAYNIADREPVSLVSWVNVLAGRMGASKPRTLPMPLLRATARMLDPIAQLGLPAPLTTEKLSKLTASFSLDITALEQSGFAWPPTTNDVLDQMVQSFPAG